MADKLQLIIEVDASAANAEIKSINSSLSNLEKSAQSTGKGFSGGVDKMSHSVTEARESLRGFGEELGIKIPRFVSSFIANLNGVGPALANAFSAVAVTGFVVVAGEALARGVVAVLNYKQALQDLGEQWSQVFDIIAGRANEIFVGEGIDAASKKQNELILASQERQLALKRELAVTGLTGPGAISAALNAQIEQITHDANKPGTGITPATATQRDKEISIARQIAGKKEVEARRAVEREIQDAQQQAIINRKELREKEIAEVNAADNKLLASELDRLKTRGLTQEQFNQLRVSQEEETAGKIAAINKKYHDEAIAAEAAFLAEVLRMNDQQSQARSEISDRATELSIEASAGTGPISKYLADLARVAYEERKRADELDRMYAKFSKTYGDDERLFEQTQQAKISIAQVAAQKQKEIVQSFGRELKSLYDRTIGRAKSVGEAFRNISSELAAFFRRKLFDEIAANVLKGQGTLGRIGAAFGLTAKISKLEQPNHIGDMNLIGGAVPVVMASSPGQQAQQSAAVGGLSSIAAGLAGVGVGLAALGSKGAAAAGPGVADVVIRSAGTVASSPGAIQAGATPPFLPSSTGGLSGILGGLKNLVGLGGPAGAGGLGRLGSALSSPLAGILGLALFGSGVSSGNKTLFGNLKTVGGGALLGMQYAKAVGASGAWGAALGAGVGLATAGLQRGGLAGLAETTAGGALIGFQFGGPVGAAIGAGIGFAAGVIRLFIKGAMEKAHDKIKAVYGIDITDKGILQQIVQTAKDNFGGNIDVAIQNPQIRDLIQLYGMTTGQKGKFARPMTNSQLIESHGSLYQSADQFNGMALSSLGGSIPTSSLDRLTSSSSSASVAPMEVHVSMSIDGKATTALMKGEAVTAIDNNPRLVSKSAVSGAKASAGRRELTAAQISPGTLVN